MSVHPRVLCRRVSGGLSVVAGGLGACHAAV